jgi:hypothetical protein
MQRVAPIQAIPLRYVVGAEYANFQVLPPSALAMIDAEPESLRVPPTA